MRCLLKKNEKDKGSKYYINDKSGARDVQTLFADLSTGAHSCYCGVKLVKSLRKTY